MRCAFFVLGSRPSVAESAGRRCRTLHAGALAVAILTAAGRGPIPALAEEAPRAVRPSGEAISDLLNEGRRQPQPIPPALPVHSAEDAAKPGQIGVEGGLLWPGGHHLAGRTGWLEHRDRAWFFTFQPSGESEAVQGLRVLENTTLAQMETYLGSSPGRRVTFSIAAELTEYMGRNYLLIRDATILKTPEVRPAVPPPVASTSGGSFQAGEQKPVPKAGRAEPDGDGDGLLSVEELMDSLGREDPVPEPIPAPSPPSRPQEPATVPPASPTGFSQNQPRHEARLIDRVGRLVREDDNWVFAFESDSDRPAEPPIRLHPNLALEKMEQHSAGATRRTLFVVSGDLSEYTGTNYLLVKRFIIQRDQGNLR